MPTIPQTLVPSVALTYSFAPSGLPADPNWHAELIADFDAGRLVGWDLTITSHEIQDGEIVTGAEHLGQVLVPSDRDPGLADVADYLPDMLDTLIAAPGVGRQIAEQALARELAREQAKQAREHLDTYLLARLRGEA